MARRNFFDEEFAIHAAVVMEHGLDGIVRADREIDRVNGLRAYDPIELATA